MTLHERGPWEDQVPDLIWEYDEEDRAGATAMLWILGFLALGLTAATVAAWVWL